MPLMNLLLKIVLRFGFFHWSASYQMELVLKNLLKFEYKLLLVGAGDALNAAKTNQSELLAKIKSDVPSSQAKQK